MSPPASSDDLLIQDLLIQNVPAMERRTDDEEPILIDMLVGAPGVPVSNAANMARWPCSLPLIILLRPPATNFKRLSTPC
jgi:hypothetical protein